MPGQFEVRLPVRGGGCTDEVSCSERAVRLHDQCNLDGRVRYVANGALVGRGCKLVGMKVGLGSR
jgi:hypothetical protein